MAKKPANIESAPVTSDSAEHETHLAVFGPGTVEYGGHKISILEINPTGLGYLLQYGFAKSLQDSVAGLAKDVKANPADYTKDRPDLATLSEEGLVSAIVAERMASRFESIRDGKVGARVGAPRLSGVDKIMRDIAREALKAASVAHGKKLPEGKELSALVEKLVAKNEAAYRVEAEKRLEAQKAVGAEVDLDALMA